MGSLDKYVPVPGDKKCLKCQRMFKSKDIKKNWLCAACTAKNLSVHNVKVSNPHLTGRRTRKTPGTQD